MELEKNENQTLWMSESDEIRKLPFITLCQILRCTPQFFYIYRYPNPRNCRESTKEVC